MFLLPFGLYCSACFGSLFVSILCTCSHFSWYCFISFTMFCAPVSCLIHWFFSLSSFVIPSRCLKNFICAASKGCSSVFFSTQTSLPNFPIPWGLLVAVHPVGALPCSTAPEDLRKSLRSGGNPVTSPSSFGRRGATRPTPLTLPLNWPVRSSISLHSPPLFGAPAGWHKQAQATKL